MSSSAQVRRARRDRTGRDQRRKSASARDRRPDLSKWYGRELPDVSPGEFRFSLDALGERGGPVSLDRFVESFGWNDESAEVSGGLNLRTQNSSERELELSRGSLVRCRVWSGGRWFEVWTMSVETAPKVVESSSWDVALVDDMARVRRGRRRYLFRTTKRRPHGWFGHDALRVAARKDGIRLGRVARCASRIDKIDVTGSFLSFALHVYRHERDETGRRFKPQMRNGRFEMLPLARNKVIYRLAGQSESVQISETPRVTNPATVLTGTARVGHGSEAKKIRHTEFDRAVVRRLGYSHKHRDFGMVASPARLRARVKRALARELRVEKSISLTVPGNPFLRWGDGVIIEVPSEGLVGANAFAYMTSVRHQVDSGRYTTEVQANFHDPFEAQREREERFARARKRRERERRAA